MTENVTLTLDIGGEGRHVDAWNLNPSATKTLGPGKGSRIPRHVRGRADAIPLPDHSVDRIIVERTPLNKAALTEIARVIAPGGSVIMRHAVPFDIDPHAMAKAILPGPVTQRTVQINGQTLQESRFDNFGNDAGACRCSIPGESPRLYVGGMVTFNLKLNSMCKLKPPAFMPAGISPSTCTIGCACWQRMT